MFCRYRKRGTNVLSVHIGRALQFNSRCSGTMHFRCLSAKRDIYIGDGSTLVAFLVLKCFCLCVFLFLVLLSSVFVLGGINFKFCPRGCMIWKETRFFSIGFFGDCQMAITQSGYEASLLYDCV